MSHIISLNFDAKSSPLIRIKLQGHTQQAHSLGWGFAWYPNDHQGAIVTKDPIAQDTQVLTEALTDWGSFRSSQFFCRLKGAAKGYTHHDAQPFSHSFAGRDWLFMHNGFLDAIALKSLQQHHSGFLEPLGKTDSELAFCYLLNQLQQKKARKIHDIDPKQWYEWFTQFDAIGSADMMLSDGHSVIAYHGCQSPDNLFYMRHQPPSPQLAIETESLSFALNDPRDAHHTTLIFSSIAFGQMSWHPMQPGQMIIGSRGSLVWSNVDDNTSFVAQPTSTQPPPPPTQPNGHETITNIRSITHTPDGQPLFYRLYEVSHCTQYRYSMPVEHSSHVFRLQPIDDHIQEVVHAKLNITSKGEEIQFEDVFGNRSIYYSINEPYQQLTINSISKVKVYSSLPDDHSLSKRQTSIPLVWMPWQRQMMMPYLLPFELPETQLTELTDYAMSFVERNDYHLLSTLNDMNQSIYRDYQYMPGTTSLNTTPFEVYVSRKGVCQDFANLLICLARLLGIPARYCVGYIYTGGEYLNKIQSEASHAWVEVYLPYVGWRGYDPTNGSIVAQDHIRVATGRSYLDATPTSGTIFRGGGEEILSVDVKINEIQE